MKLGLGLYRQGLTSENFRFARQLGAEALVVHLVNYFEEQQPKIGSGEHENGLAFCGDDEIWSEEELSSLVKEAGRHGLKIEAIENFSPNFWYDILLDGPEKEKQMEGLKRLVRNVGRAGIPTIGYNFSIAGLWGWHRAPEARGGAETIVYDESRIDKDSPIPDGMVWNMRYRPRRSTKNVPSVTRKELWERAEFFLRNLMPAAENEGVVLAAHPDDPPADSLRGCARFINQPGRYFDLFNLVESPNNKAELCLGAVQEMSEGESACDVLESLLKMDKVAYIHLRNVKGKVPRYREVFIDEGDLDVRRAVSLLKSYDYRGVLIPDHTPDLSCEAPWHAGMAFALGYIKALIQ